MSAHEEVEENLHHAHEPFDKTVAGSMAIIAALLAIVSVLGQHFNTETLLNQQLASDQWAFYQAKDIRRYVAEANRDDLASMKADPQLVAKYKADSVRYRIETAKISDDAKEFLKERDVTGRRANRFHFGEVFLEVAIVLCSLAILTKRKPLFVGGVGSGLIGVVIGLTALWT